MATYDWNQALNSRPKYGPTISNAQSLSPTPQEKLSLMQKYKKKKNPFETDKNPLFQKDNVLKSYEPKKTQASTLNNPNETTFGKVSSGEFYKPFKEEEVKPIPVVKLQQPKPINFPFVQPKLKTIKPPSQANWEWNTRGRFLCVRKRRIKTTQKNRPSVFPSVFPQYLLL